MSEFLPPVDQLLSFEEGRDWPLKPDQWPDYVERFGLAAEHIPALIKMATHPPFHEEEATDDEIWAPAHAWRALGQLKAVEAVKPLLPLFDKEGDDRLHEELPGVFGVIGPQTIPPLATALAARAAMAFPAIDYANCFEEIVRHHPESRDAVVTAICNQLEQYQTNSTTLNASLIWHLAELKIVSAAPLMEEAFKAEKVDYSYAGDWEEIQLELGLLEERLTPKPHFFNLENSRIMRAIEAEARRAERANQRKHAQKRKSKRKQSKQSRKRNRKRR
jgi:hypothetical protein